VEQIDIGGGATIRGQILVRNAASVSSTVTSNSIHGGADIIYDGSFDDVFFSVSAWRRY
jgi:hypothetical protein